MKWSELLSLKGPRNLCPTFAPRDQAPKAKNPDSQGKLNNSKPDQARHLGCLSIKKTTFSKQTPRPKPYRGIRFFVGDLPHDASHENLVSVQF
jgi:hypothetical protein